MQELFFVGQYKEKVWEVEGIFSSKKKAVSACIKENYFVIPLTLDVALPDDTVECTGSFYPLLEDDPNPD